jgi:hypothetical protein
MSMKYSSPGVARVPASQVKEEKLHSKVSCHIPQVQGSFEYTLNDWRLVPHRPGEATLSPSFTIAYDDLWCLEVFPEGKDVNFSGNVTFNLRNVAKQTVRASCRLTISGRKNSQKEIICETEPAKPFSSLSDWTVDTGLTFSETAEKNSMWLQEDGSLQVIVEMKICGKPESMYGPGLKEMSTVMEPDEAPVPSLADDMLHLLDLNSSIIALESGDTIVTTTNGGAKSYDMLWKSDITLASEDEKVPCHQCILAARSPVFCDMLQTGATSMKMFLQAGKIYVTKHVHPSVLRVFVCFLYTDHCDENFLLEDNGLHLGYLLRAGCKYEVKGLIALCSEYLIATLSVENAATRLGTACACKGCDKLRDAILHFIALHVSDVTLTEGFQELDASVCRMVVGEIATPPATPKGEVKENDQPDIEREASREGREVEEDSVDRQEHGDIEGPGDEDKDQEGELPSNYRGGFHRLESMNDQFDETEAIGGSQSKTVFREAQGESKEEVKRDASC